MTFYSVHGLFIQLYRYYKWLTLRYKVVVFALKKASSNSLLSVEIIRRFSSILLDCWLCLAVFHALSVRMPRGLMMRGRSVMQLMMSERT